jgi:hypothetical protein
VPEHYVFSLVLPNVERGYLALQLPKGGIAMSENNTDAQEIVRIPIMQRVLDNPFILLFIGVVVPAVFYIVWGIMELVTIPVAN